RDTASVFCVVWGFTVWNLRLYQYFRERVGVATGVLRELFYTWGQMQDIAIGLDRVFELLDRKPEVEDAPGAVAMPPFRSAVVFRGVTFGYQKDRQVLQDIDLAAPIGTITAIIGPTRAA